MQLPVSLLVQVLRFSNSPFSRESSYLIGPHSPHCVALLYLIGSRSFWLVLMLLPKKNLPGAMPRFGLNSLSTFSSNSKTFPYKCENWVVCVGFHLAERSLLVPRTQFVRICQSVQTRPKNENFVETLKPIAPLMMVSLQNKKQTLAETHFFNVYNLSLVSTPS